MKHIIQAGLQLAFLWVFIALYLITMIPLAVVVAFLSPAQKREKK